MLSSRVLKISDAALLALHAMVILAGSEGELVTTQYLAARIGASKNHLSKVLQVLSHAGFVEAVRGPHGGFVLARPADNVKLIDIYEAIEGPIRHSNCLLDRPHCDRERCILGNLMRGVNDAFTQHFSNTTLASVVER